MSCQLNLVHFKMSGVSLMPPFSGMLWRAPSGVGPPRQQLAIIGPGEIYPHPDWLGTSFSVDVRCCQANHSSKDGGNVLTRSMGPPIARGVARIMAVLMRLDLQDRFSKYFQQAEKEVVVVPSLCSLLGTSFLPSIQPSFEKQKRFSCLGKSKGLYPKRKY